MKGVSAHLHVREKSEDTYLDVSRVLGDNTSSHILRVLDNLRDAPRHIGRAILSPRSLLRSNDQVGHKVSGNLVIGLDECSIEAEKSFQGRARHQRRMRDLVDLGEEIMLDLWECIRRSRFEENRENVQGVCEEGDVCC